MIPVRPVELALLEVLTESNTGAETALEALAKVVPTTLAESGDYTAGAALLRAPRSRADARGVAALGPLRVIGGGMTRHWREPDSNDRFRRRRTPPSLCRLSFAPY